MSRAGVSGICEIVFVEDLSVCRFSNGVVSLTLKDFARYGVVVQMIGSGMMVMDHAAATALGLFNGPFLFGRNRRGG
jgi:hypothetical protein